MKGLKNMQCLLSVEPYLQINTLDALKELLRRTKD